MNKIFVFARLIRFKNLIMIALTQYLVKIFILDVRFIAETALSDSLFFYLVLSTILIAAAGYIINDVYDVSADMINKREKIIIGVHLSQKIAMFWYLLLNLLSLIFGLLICWGIQKPMFFLIFIYCIFSLWIYSKSLKKMFLVGNLQISFLTALAIVNVALFDVLGVLGNGGTEALLFKIILWYSFFAFLINLIRELIKDAEDIEGDKIINAKTTAIVLGIKKVKIILITLCLFIFGFIAYFQYIQYSFYQTKFMIQNQEMSFILPGTDIISIGFVLIIQLMIILLSYKILRAYKKEDFSSLSSLSKFIMMLGILTIPLFYISYIL